MKLEFPEQIFAKYSSIKFLENPSSMKPKRPIWTDGQSEGRTDGRTDGQRDRKDKANIRFSTFYNLNEHF